MLSWADLDQITEEALADDAPQQQIFLGFPYGAAHAAWWKTCQAELSAKYSVTFRVPSGGDVTGHLFKNVARDIAVSGLCVFDMTGANPNVCVELGFATALGKIIKIARASTDTAPVPADVQGQHYLQFSSERDLTDQLDSFLVNYYRAKHARWDDQTVRKRLRLQLSRRGYDADVETLAQGIGCDDMKLVRDILQAYPDFEFDAKDKCWQLR